LSRVVDRQFVFGELEREQFVRYLREYESFCGVRVLTYCILSNHFHLLIEVPAKPTEPLSAEELIAKLKALSSTALTVTNFFGVVKDAKLASQEFGVVFQTGVVFCSPIAALWS
jgi:REP element-mobilizing transposase RayT